MPFIPNEADAGFADQAEPDAQDFEVLKSGSQATGVVSGCAVTAQGSPDMTCAVAAGVVAVAGAKVNVAAGNATITTAHGTNPRIDLVVVSSAGAKSVTAGTAAAQPVFPAIPANSVVLAAVYVPANDTTIASNQITDKRVFVFPPEATTNYDLAKARSLVRVKERSETVTMDTGQIQIHGSAMANGRLYFTTRTEPAYFIRCNNLEDLTDRTSFQFAADGFHNNGDALVYVAETDRLYVLFANVDRVYVSEVHPTTLAVTNVINDTANVAGVSGAICSDGANLFVATNTPPAKLLKYRLSDFSLQGTATFTGRNDAHAVLYDGVNVYVTGNASPAWIARVNPTDMSFTDGAFPTGVTTLTDDIASVGDYIWAAREAAAQPLVRVNKADLTTEVVRIPGMPSNTAFALHFDGRYIWLGLNATPGILARIDPQSGVGAFHTFATGEDGANEILSDGARLFVTFWMSPAKVKRLVPPAMPGPGLPVTSISTQSTSDTTAGTSEETLLTYAVPGSTLGNDGDALRITTSGSFAANANNKRVLLKFGLASPVTVFDTGSLPFNDTRWWLEAICIRTGANAQDWACKWTSDSSLLATDVQHATTTQTDTGTLNINVRGHTPSAAGEVVNEHLLVEIVN